ncbi:MAG: hypothetical protein Q7R84_01795 [bacterium]|nr:hypothetical protein [bacterium]
MKKILGMILLFGGLAVIFYSLYFSYGIFNAKKEAPVIFNTPKQPEVQDQLQKALGEQLKGILPADSIPQLLNLISWSILASILTFGGAQISGLGIKLLK